MSARIAGVVIRTSPSVSRRTTRIFSAVSHGEGMRAVEPGVDQAALPGEVNAAQMDLPAETISPVAYLAVGLMALLFGSLTVLPLLCAGNRKHTADR